MKTRLSDAVRLVLLLAAMAATALAVAPKQADAIPTCTPGGPCDPGSYVCVESGIKCWGTHN